MGVGYCSVADGGAGVVLDDAVVEEPEVVVGEAHADLPLERVGDVHVGRLDPPGRVVRTRGQVDVQPVLVLVEREQRAREQVLRLLRERRHRLRVGVGCAEDGDVVALGRGGAERETPEIGGDVRAGVEQRRGGGDRVRRRRPARRCRRHPRPRGRRRRFPRRRRRAGRHRSTPTSGSGGDGAAGIVTRLRGRP